MHNRHLLLPAIVLTTACITGCVVEENESALDLGSVSIGEQLIDLKKARDAGAISGKEYRKLKADLLLLVDNASATAGSANDQESLNTHAERNHENAEDDDEESGFLF